MKRSLLLLIVGVLVLSGCAGTFKTMKEPASEIAAPLVDRELFFGDPQISNSQLSPDGKHLSFIKPYKNVRNIWVKNINDSFDAARPITADKRPVPGYFWSRDSKYLLYVQDKGGNENFHVYAVDPTSKPDPATGVPPARDLTPIEGIRAMIYSVPKNKPDEIIIGLNERDASYHDVYRVEIATGKRELLIKNTQKVAGYLYDPNGEVRLAIRQKDDAGFELLRVDGGDLKRIYECSWQESCFPIRLHKDGKRCYLVSNKGPEADLTNLMLIDIQTGSTELLESDPEKRVDFGGAEFSEATDELMATYYIGDRLRIYPKNDAVKRDLELFKKELPEGELGIGSMTRDMRFFLVSVSRDVDPGSVYLYDREKGKLKLQYRSRPELPSAHLAHMKPVRYQARDGLSVPAYLTLPRGVEPKKLPTVILPHGGPTTRDYWGYDPYAQFLANRGYAVLQPNYRGSTGYGEKFLNAGNRTWGTGASQHDATDGVKWLIAQGTSDPDRICIFGGSWGGYMTLAGVTFTPDLYKCGVPYVAPSNLVTLLESIPAYWRPFAKSLFMRLGDPEVEADRKDLESRSPFFFSDRIKVPLLVIQGANDPRVKKAEADSIVVAVRNKGKPVEYLVAPDEGHGFRAPENRLAVAVAMEKFLAKQIGGRLQDEVSPEIAERLAKITVDPAGVKMPDKFEKALLARAEIAPLPVIDGSAIQPATFTYKMQMDMGSRKMDIDLTRVIERSGEKKDKLVRITSTMKLPMGEQVDVFDLDAKTLRPIERRIKGMATVKLNYSADSITGEMAGGGRKMPIDAKLKAPVLGDGAGLELAVAGLPLNAGYSTTLRTFESMTQKVRVMKLSVTGQELTQAAAGKFKTWVLELRPLDGEVGGGGTLRVQRKAPHHLVRSQYQLPAMMGGGTVSSELVSEGKAGGS
ncbi:MAG TPA: S9 family peptidase [Myxococcota bacterium]|nr:S9 family peptidase [Myxococcota bacterium]